MQKLIKRWLCQHVMFWSERRQGEVCYKCGKFRSAIEAGVLTLPDPDLNRTLN